MATRLLRQCTARWCLAAKSLPTAKPTRNLSTVSLGSASQSIAGRSRFYKTVDVEPISGDEFGTYKVLLDKRTLKTPAGNPLQLPTKGLALAIAVEWDAQEAGSRRGIQPSTMPMMTLASTAIDQILPDSFQTKKTCLSYLPTDTALFFTSEEDRILLRKQKQHFQPIIRWMKKMFELELKTSQTMSGKLQHPEGSFRRIEWMVDNMDHFTLACLQCMTMECKSVVLGLAYLCRHLNFDQVKAASRLEEEFQVEIWGVVEGGHDMDRLNNAVALSSAGVFMNLLHDSNKLDALIQKWKGPIPEAVSSAPLKYSVSPLQEKK